MSNSFGVGDSHGLSILLCDGGASRSDVGNGGSSGRNSDAGSNVAATMKMSANYSSKQIN